jgi:predicted permease
MLNRLKNRFAETHGVQFELVRHFLARFFDTGISAGSSDWMKVAAGVLAMLVSFAILGVRTYVRRYTDVMYFGTPDIYREMVRADLVSFIALAMLATALLALLEWQALFPSVGDYLAMAGLPVGARQIFAAKFTALVLLFTVYVLAATVAPALLFAGISGCKWQWNPSGIVNAWADFAALAGACVFVFFSLIALHGLLLNLLPGRIFARVSLAVQATLFIVSLAGLSLMGKQPGGAEWWPPVWFLGLWESIAAGRPGAGRNALLAIAIPPVVAVAAYLVSYHRYRRLLLEAPAPRGARRTRAGAWLLERWIRDPREEAAFAFLWKTLARSRVHRLILLAYAGLALGWIADGALDTPAPTLRDEGMYGLFAVLVPLGLAMLITLGLRYVFLLPVALEANWVFRIAAHDGRTAWLRAVERFVIWLGIVPVFLASLPAGIAIFGAPRAAAASVISLLAALIWFEALFRGWQKLPFTCSYLPGKRPVLFTVARYAIALPLLAPAGELILFGSRDLSAFMALITLLTAVWLRMRARRRNFWSGCDLRFEEQEDAAVMTLGLAPDEESGTRGAGSQPASEVPIFSGSLVDSRRRLPEELAEERDAESRGPARLIESILEDIRFGWRMIRRNPLFSAIVVMTLTVGIGVNASVFTAVNGLAFRPHVYKDPETFLRIVPQSRMLGTSRRASFAEYAAFRESSRTLRGLAAFTHFPAFIGLDNSAGAVGMAVSCNFFEVDGPRRILLGRLFTEEDCRSSGPPVVLVGEAFWRARLHSDPRAVGRTLEVNGRPVTLAGVVPERTAGWTRTLGWSRPPAVWVPFTLQTVFEQPGAKLYGDEELWLSLAGRLAPGFSRSQARAELDLLARRMDRLHAGRETAIRVTDGSWIEELEVTGSAQQWILMILLVGAFNLVLFISCANVATLLLARAASRRREIAIRLSMGAPRIRLIRMLVTEGMLLAALAGAASLFLIERIPAPLYRVVTGRAPDFPISPDWRTFFYLTAVVLLTGVLAGLAPALESLKVNLTGSLKGGAASGGGALVSGAAPRLQGLLVSAQVAMSMVLLVAAALFARAEQSTLRSDPGYLPAKVVVAPLYFSDGMTMRAAASRLAAIVQRVQALPGVHSVALSEGMPVFDHATVELRPPRRPDARQPVDLFSASPGFFETLGIPMIAGREFRLMETGSVIVSRRLARILWPRQDPVGQPLALPGGDLVTVAGVVRDVDPMRFGGSENPALYRPWRPTPVRNVLSVRFDAGEATGAAAVRAAIREVEPNLLAIAALAETWIDQLTEELWNVVALVLLLGVVAAVLATAGIYAAVSFAVSQRTRELGIRMALGARKADIIRHILLAGGKPVMKGLLAGLWLSVAVCAGLRQSFTASPVRLDTANPLPYCGAALLLALAALAAVLAPARRGAGARPLSSLGAE